MRIILLLHRYLAVAVGLLMTLWCLSGFVMMYQSYPTLGEDERLAGLAPLDLGGCCNLEALPSDDADAPRFRIEMLRGEPVLRLASGGRRSNASVPIGLRTGSGVTELAPAEVLEVAAEYARGHGIGGRPRFMGSVDVDQWVVQAAPRNQPAYRVVFDDAAGNEIYVSGATGEVFQDTNRRERVLSWLGAIPHWLYPTELRKNGALWTEVVIWTSVVGTFLTLTGLYVGVSRFRRRGKDRRLRSPYRGLWYWHHIGGLVFGVLALTWVFSGLMTMNPWGTLSGGAAGSSYTKQITRDATWGEVKQFLAAAGAAADRFRGFAQLESAPFDGRLYVLGYRPDGTRLRLDASGQRADLTASQVEAATARLEAPVLAFTTMEDEDNYHYGHKQRVELPVYRLILDDEEQTRLYISPSSGSVSAVDATRRTARWIRTGLHGLDFPGLRVRPVWDVVVVLLLAGVTVVCATGSWMALKRVRRDWRKVRLAARGVCARGGQRGDA